MEKITLNLQNIEVVLTPEELKSFFSGVLNSDLHMNNDSVYNFLKVLEYCKYPEQEYVLLNPEGCYTGKQRAEENGVKFG